MHFRRALLRVGSWTVAALACSTLAGCAPGYMKASELERLDQGPGACAKTCEDLKMKMVAIVLVGDTLPGCVCQVLETQGAAKPQEAEPAATPPAAAPAPAPEPAPAPGEPPPTGGPAAPSDGAKEGAAASTAGYVVIAAAAAAQQQQQRKQQQQQQGQQGK